MTGFRFENDGRLVRADKVVFIGRIAANSVTLAKGKTYVLLRMGGEYHDDRPAEAIYLLRLDDIASLITILFGQTVRDGKGQQLMKLIAADFARLNEATD